MRYSFKLLFTASTALCLFSLPSLAMDVEQKGERGVPARGPATKDQERAVAAASTVRPAVTKDQEAAAAAAASSPALTLTLVPEVLSSSSSSQGSESWASLVQAYNSLNVRRTTLNVSDSAALRAVEGQIIARRDAARTKSTNALAQLMVAHANLDAARQASNSLQVAAATQALDAARSITTEVSNELADISYVADSIEQRPQEGAH